MFHTGIQRRPTLEMLQIKETKILKCCYRLTTLFKMSSRTFESLMSVFFKLTSLDGVFPWLRFNNSLNFIFLSFFFVSNCVFCHFCTFFRCKPLNALSIFALKSVENQLKFLKYKIRKKKKLMLIMIKKTFNY